ncbi:MAG: hypothetical protein ACR2H1_03910, partial [Limisphaerales bacterium]
RNVVRRDAENLARLRVAETAIAIERFRLKHNQLPNYLENLVPEFISKIPNDTFQQIRYKKLTKEYVVYSIGRDRQDDGGTEKDSAKQKKTSKANNDAGYDLTFTVEH